MTESTVHTERGTDVLLVLGNVLQVRNYVTSGLLSSLLGDGVNVAVVAPSNTLPILRNAVSNLDGMYPLESVQLKARHRMLLRWLRNGSWVSRRNVLEYRWKIDQWARRGMTSKAALAFWRVAEMAWGAETVARFVVSRLRASPAAWSMVRSINPTLIVWATSISDPADFELIKAASDMGKPILMCEVSWDNLTTKGAIWPRPERLLVWGEYSRRLALEDHGFRKEQVVVTGPPHWDVYASPKALTPRGEWFAQHDLDDGKRMILFGGTTVSKVSEEAYAVRLLSEWIDSGALPPSYIWYRPHPRYRVRVHDEGVASIPHVIVDPGVPGDDSQPEGNWSLDPNEALQRANAVNSCDVILSAFSTIVVEGALLGKPTVLLGFAQSGDVAPAAVHPSLSQSHVHYFLRCPWIRVARSAAELRGQLAQFIALESESAHDALRQFGLSIARCGDGLGSQRTIESIRDMLADIGPTEQASDGSEMKADQKTRRIWQKPRNTMRRS